MRPGYLFFIIVASLMFLSSGSLSAQQGGRNEKPVKKLERFVNRINLGGYLGAQFGTITVIDVSPRASIRVTDRFYPGIGFTYQYYQDKRYSPSYSSNAYGGSLYASYYVWRDLFAHLEYAPLYVNYYDYYPDGSGGYYKVKNAVWVHDLMVGGGYRQWIGERAFISLMVLFNVNESLYSPYRNPVIRMGFGVGL